MALADIIGRIESDAGADSRRIVEDAEARAEALIAEAKRAAARHREETIAAACRAAESRAGTLRANARLAARDLALAARREVVERVFHEVEARIIALEDGRYTDVIARGIAVQALGGDIVRVAQADAKRLAGLATAVEKAAVESGRKLKVTIAKDAADIPHGVTLEAGRVTSEVSPASLVAAHHDQLTATVARVLFGEEEAEE